MKSSKGKCQILHVGTKKNIYVLGTVQLESSLVE